MRQEQVANVTSRVWLTPDLGLGFHYFDYSPSQYDGLPHMHGEYCVVMCLSGTLEVQRGKLLDLLQGGEILIVNPGEIHHCRFGLDGRHSSGFTLILRPSALRPLLAAMTMPYGAFSRDFRFLGKVQNPPVFELVTKVIQEYGEQRSGYAAMAETIVRQMLIHLLREWPPHAAEPAEFRLPPQLPWLHMHRATEYMNSHGKCTFRLPDLCAEVGLSASRFIPLFKNSSGVSPHSYYNALLVHKARRLLQVEGSSTKQAAYALGFRNVSHFCTLFHHVAGATPGSCQGPSPLVPSAATELI